MSRSVTVSESILVAASPEAVWDFTQDFAKRSSWDRSVLEATVVQETPERLVRVRLRGRTAATLHYKAFHRPSRTSLAMQDVRSPIFAGGGGSWSYEAVEGATRWMQTNTLTFRGSLSRRLLGPFVARSLRRATRRSMTAAKGAIERGG